MGTLFYSLDKTSPVLDASNNPFISFFFMPTEDLGKYW